MDEARVAKQKEFCLEVGRLLSLCQVSAVVFVLILL